MVYQNKTPVSRGRSTRVRAFYSGIPRSNYGITILYPKSSISFFNSNENGGYYSKIVTKLDRKKYTY